MSPAELRCTRCRGALGDDGGELVCGGCGARFAISDGVPVFAEADDYYEGRFTETIDYCSGSSRRLKSRLALRPSFLRRHLRRGSAILDLGCGGGTDLIAGHGTVAGVDLSLESLRRARGLYPVVARADASQLPFADGAFDHVVSMDFLGHVPLERKDAVIAEIARVLRPGGTTIHYAETDGDNLFSRVGRLSPELHRERFIELEGHHGLERPSALVARFERAGLRAVEARGAYSTALRPLDEYLNRFGGGYRELHWLPRVSVPVAAAASRVPGAKQALNMGVDLFYRAAERRLPLDAADGLLLAAVKR